MPSELSALPVVEQPHTTPKESDLFASGLLATKLPLLPGCLQLPVPLRMELLLPPGQHVLIREINQKLPEATAPRAAGRHALYVRSRQPRGADAAHGQFSCGADPARSDREEAQGADRLWRHALSPHAGRAAAGDARPICPASIRDELSALEKAGVKVFSVWTFTGLGQELPTLQPDIATWKPSLTLIKDTTLGTAPFTFYYPKGSGLLLLDSLYFRYNEHEHTLMASLLPLVLAFLLRCRAGNISRKLPYTRQQYGRIRVT